MKVDLSQLKSPSKHKVTAIIEATMARGVMSFQWNGPRDGILGISGVLWRQADPEYCQFPIGAANGAEAKFGPFSLVVVKYDVVQDIVYCIRRDAAEQEL